MEGLARWKGKAALVTGASSGIGEATARALAHAGIKVAIAARNAEKLEQMREELGGVGAEVLAVPTDLQREPEIQTLFETIRAQWGGLDILINNAGLGLRGSMAQGSNEDWRELLEVNVLAASICMREAMHDMEDRDEAHIINISSVGAHLLLPESAMYSASKHALRALTEGTRIELAAKKSRIRIGMISPGMVVSDFRRRSTKGRQDSRTLQLDFTPLESEDIADLVCFMLATPQRVQIHDMIVRGTGQPH